MVDLVKFKHELGLIVSNLAKAVMREVITAAERDPWILQDPGSEEKLGGLVDGLCVGAVYKILRVLELPPPPPPVQHEESPEPLRAPPAAPEGVTEPEGGGDGGAEGPSRGQTYILVYGSPAASSKCVLLSLQSQNNAQGEKISDASGEATTLLSEHSSPSPPPQADVPDHEYAQPAFPLPAVASAAVSGVPAAGGSKRQRSSRKKESNKPQSTESSDALSQCQQCAMLFPNAERLSDHQRKSHPLCSTCGACFTGIQRLREHEIHEHGLLPYGCEYCPKRFKHKPHLKLHVKARHTGEKTCTCDVCGKGYSCSSMLKTHRMTHFEKKFTCDVCGRSFHHACHLTRHKLVHQEVRPHKCSVCGKGFSQAANLRSHQMIHSGERQLCSICGKSYRRLRDHIISQHSHDPPTDELAGRDTSITCDVCGKKFPYLSQFKVHQRAHTGEKPFHCDICGKSYRLKELLRDHRYTHTGEKPYRCTHCSKTFNLATSFMRHRSIHSGETPYSCSDCGKHFRLLTYLKAHLQTKAHLKQTQQKPGGPSYLRVPVS
ncbi:zinc finger protein 135-like isoform X2 [Notolabrus celidotus]|uniref:zinc finger protein 135-like isoform X2 n=1 Tax=Notolabrus celidotus TaxID=1203425 RepID=UPI00148FD6D2|nr:zinc finger protein 135-like isoform X2 [Notolabrus celidotus]